MATVGKMGGWDEMQRRGLGVVWVGVGLWGVWGLEKVDDGEEMAASE